MRSARANGSATQAALRTDTKDRHGPQPPDGERQRGAQRQQPHGGGVHPAADGRPQQRRQPPGAARIEDAASTSSMIKRRRGIRPCLESIRSVRNTSNTSNTSVRSMACAAYRHHALRAGRRALLGPAASSARPPLGVGRPPRGRTAARRGNGDPTEGRAEDRPGNREPKPVSLWWSRTGALPADVDRLRRAFLRRSDLEHTSGCETDCRAGPPRTPGSGGSRAAGPGWIIAARTRLRPAGPDARPGPARTPPPPRQDPWTDSRTETREGGPRTADRLQEQAKSPTSPVGKLFKTDTAEAAGKKQAA